MKRKTSLDSRKARAVSRARGKSSSNVPPRHRRKSTRLDVPRTAGTAGAKTGTLRGRSRRKPPRRAPQRSAAERRKRAAQLFGPVGASTNNGVIGLA
jgi:hypothetical protein